MPIDDRSENDNAETGAAPATGPAADAPPEARAEGAADGAAANPGEGDQAAAGGVAAQPATVAGRNQRPQNVADLMFEAETYDGWFSANWKHNRFYVLNAKKLIGDLKLEHTKGAPAFTEAKRIINEDTDWPTQFAFDYGCSHTSIYPDKIESAKSFGHAVTIIVALEVWAASHNSSINVYDYLRIIPAQYFVDQLDKKRLADLAKHHNELTEDEKTAKFGVDARLSFNKLCVQRISQINENLLLQMVSGMCVTRLVGENLIAFINEHYPEDLHIGPVLPCGSDDAVSPGLGRKNAATALRVPKLRAPELISPPYLA